MSRKARVFAGISRRPGNTAQAAIEGGRYAALVAGETGGG